MIVRQRCPAKLNLFLAVGPPDATGYHPVRTILQTVNLFDDLTVQPSARDEIVCDWAGLPEENSLTKVLRLVREAAHLGPVRIELTKRIPSQAGLGGGSSDAAGLIRALQPLLPAPLPEELLTDIAAAVGVDTVFLLRGGCCQGEGYGERLKPIESPAWVYVVAMPRGAACPTAEAYAKLDAAPREWREFPTDDVLYNDFERVAPCESLELLERLLALGAHDAGLSGSGAAVFGRFASREAAERAREGLDADAWVCEPVPAYSMTDLSRS